MGKIEYQNFKNQIEEFKKLEKKPTLLLHSCCGPCSTHCLKVLSEAFDITIFYYNPNIYPSEEYDKRLEYQKKVIEKMNLNIKVLPIKEDYSVYLNVVDGYTNLGEGSMRCYLCYEFRIKRLAETAEKEGFDYFTTVMSVSPYKNSKWINEIGEKYQGNSKFLYSDFKKENGYVDSINLSKEYDLYRQDWCGCEFSLKEHEERLKSKVND